MIETGPKFVYLGFQGRDSFLECRLWFWWLGDEPTDAVCRGGQSAFLELPERVAHSHLCNSVFFSQFTGGGESVSDCLLLGLNLFQQVMEHAPVWLAGLWLVAHVDTLQQLT